MLTALQLVALALALAVDAATAAATVGVAGARRVLLVRASLVFGAFQAGMAGLGAALGVAGAQLLGAALPWIAGTALVGLGGWVLFVPDTEEDAMHIDSWPAVVALAFATSVDALAAGLALPLWDVPVAVSLAAIGLITTAASLGAGLAGAAAAHRMEGPWERVAGLVLVVLGLRTLWGAW